ncbi:hypothetical protein O6H91_08G087800 [Diphasiastrum complanatum]|uniref:Uncharacterized protein n=1 Tax=Diphasiastrum complanatum TaxID=34168 RepID=A0ACC2D009_DIPCM|nr:hypothetical protein O6H91_08G087800 [Diphasiastrum complanatum]
MLESIVAPWRPRPAAPAAPALSHSSCYNYNPAAAAGAAPKGGMRAVRCGLAEPSGKPAPMGQKTRYNDSLFDKAFMFLFARKMEAITGKSSTKEGYEGFVDVSRSVMQGRTPVEQQAIVRQVLLSMLPPGAPKTFQKLFPPTRSSAEINAAITVPFFQWLVGPCEQVEVEVNGLKQKSGVHISKCRTCYDKKIEEDTTPWGHWFLITDVCWSQAFVLGSWQSFKRFLSLLWFRFLPIHVYRRTQHLVMQPSASQEKQ